MPSTYQFFKTSEKLEQTGIVIDYGDFRFRVARAGGANKEYQKALERKTRPFKRAIQADAFTNDQAIAVLREVYAETVILGWEGVTDESGKPMEFSRENALKLFNDLPDLFSDLMQQANNSALYREQLRGEDAKN